MLRINRETTGENNEVAVLRLEGHVTGPWVEELRHVCHQAISPDSRSLVLDLTNVHYVDANGIALLRELTASGVSLANLSKFVGDQLKEVANGDE